MTNYRIYAGTVSWHRSMPGWLREKDLNLRPPAYETGALPTALPRDSSRPSLTWIGCPMPGATAHALSGLSVNAIVCVCGCASSARGIVPLAQRLSHCRVVRIALHHAPSKPCRPIMRVLYNPRQSKVEPLPTAVSQHYLCRDHNRINTLMVDLGGIEPPSETLSRFTSRRLRYANDIQQFFEVS